MPEFIRKSKLIENTCYSLFYCYEGHNGWGFGFDCDKVGNVDMAQFERKPAALENYNGCLKGEVNGRKVKAPIIQTFKSRYRKPAAIRCSCGAEIDLYDPMTNECDCGRAYNGSGQTLAPKECHGEETGEHPSDIANWRSHNWDGDY